MNNESVTIDFILEHPKTAPLIESAWYAAYSAERKSNHFPNSEQAASVADVEVAGQLGLKASDMCRLRDAGLRLRAV